MDQLRYFIGLLAKHIDTQIALLMTPEFSYGLSASLVGNVELGTNVGPQVAANRRQFHDAPDQLLRTVYR
jgi:hypothetical protein